MAAKHIEVALSQGAEAGMDAFLSTPVSRRSPNYAEIVGNGRRSQATMLGHYCRVFGIEGNTSNAVVADRVLDDKQALLEAIVALSDRIDALDGEGHSKKATTVKTDVIVTNDEFITEDVAWAILGRGVNRPREERRAEGATNAQLWRMNQTGVFSPDEIARLNAVATS